MNALLEQAIAATRAAGALTLQYFGGVYQVEDKGSGDPLTTADLAVDAYLKKALLDIRPDCGWLSEETVDDHLRLEREAVWIVDPVDGTREFVEGLPEYVVAVALVEAGAPTLAVICNPAQDQLYAAVKDGGTSLNGQRVFCSEVQDLAKATATVSRREIKRGEIDPYRPHLGEIRPVGSVAYKLALAAAGACDLNFSVQPKNEWDVCAGDLLVREAGGQMLDRTAKVRSYNQRDPLIAGGLAAGNEQLVAQILHHMQEQG
ncbi:MAG: 3'(2'),5'-bisphosphate nucleotidase CysQ [Candidatus Latescibacterota bacterium]|nr:3'(2'),5'-bisphosphate nucleotidase CysQ [Candidatus Latescibacterota bacterium]